MVGNNLKTIIMKKAIISALMLTAFATTATYAQTAKTTATPATTAPATPTPANEEDKTKIEPAELPAAVKATLATETYKDWKVTSAWTNKQSADYVVELKKDDKTNLVTIDKDGKVK